MKKAKGQPAPDRGEVKQVTLKRPIMFNGNLIKKAVIEIDHINCGLDSFGNLKTRKRTNFNLADIEKFLERLDGEFLHPIGFKKRVTRYLFRIECPVPGRFKDREFIMIFTTDYDKSDEIYTITLYPGW